MIADTSTAAEVRHTKIRRIGESQGRNSEVWLADDHQRGEEIVIKEIRIGAFAGAVEAYYKESQTICAASGSHVVPLLYAGATQTHVVLAMPIFPGGSLTDRIAQVPLTVRDVISLAQDVAAGLGAIHASGHVHLDLKPSNVLFDAGGRAHVADFGQALPVDSLGFADPAFARLYSRSLPPEYLARRDLTRLSDVYQLGLVLYRAVNGEPWFQEGCPNQFAQLRQAIIDGRFPAREYLPHVPLRLRGIVNKALDVNPANRYESPAAVAKAVGAVSPAAADWAVTSYAPTEVHWRLERESECALEVRVYRHCDGDWRIEVWTCSPKGRRRRKADWREGLKKTQAFSQLNGLFRKLSELQ
ncbi:MAG: serine/threonine protein kinase [Sandaracinaceae bacterium]|nr:serine/threonine protein kinase [Sandaracinaceae bacterium]